MFPYLISFERRLLGFQKTPVPGLWVDPHSTRNTGPRDPSSCWIWWQSSALGSTRCAFSLRYRYNSYIYIYISMYLIHPLQALSSGLFCFLLLYITMLPKTSWTGGPSLAIWFYMYNNIRVYVSNTVFVDCFEAQRGPSKKTLKVAWAFMST